MKGLQKLIALLLLLTGNNKMIPAQGVPSDFFHQLPEIFTEVCTASNAQLQEYSERLKGLKNNLQSSMELIQAMKIKAQPGAAINSNADLTELDKQLKQTKKLISTTDYSVKFDTALHNDTEKEMIKKIEELNKKGAASSDYKEMLDLLEQEKKVRAAYCKAASPPYLELLFEQRKVIENELNSIVKANDLTQQINCKLFGATYFPELSYENAYLRILDHLNYMNLLLIFYPGNE